MVFRKSFRRMRSRARSLGGKLYRRSKKSYSSGGLMGEVLPAALYGVVRAPAARMLAPVSSKLPLGGYEDEALLAVAGYLLSKNSSGIIQKVGRTAVIVEAASVASQASAGMMGTQAGVSTSAWS